MFFGQIPVLSRPESPDGSLVEMEHRLTSVRVVLVVDGVGLGVKLLKPRPPQVSALWMLRNERFGLGLDLWARAHVEHR
jgi:hypothetical protein